MKTISQTLGVVSDTDMSQGVEPLVSAQGHGPHESLQENSPNDSVDSKTSESESYNEKGGNGDSKKLFPTKNRMIQAKDRTTKAKIQRILNLKVNFPIQIQKIRLMKMISIIHLILKSYMQVMMIGKTHVIQKSKTTVHCTRKRSAPP